MKQKIFFAILAAIFFIPFLGNAHLFDWDEINFAELSREMLVLGDYWHVHINYQPFWEKPPLFFWFQALAMKIFGMNEFAARLPNAICGIITLVLIFDIGKRLFNNRFGVIWALAYFGSILPFLYFKSGIIDPFFNLFIFLGLYYFILGYWKKYFEPQKIQHNTEENSQKEYLKLDKSLWFYFFLGGLFIGLGILTKGPVAYLIAFLTLFVYWIFQKFRRYISISQFLWFSISATFVTLIWFGIEIYHNGFWFVEEFIVYQIRLFSTPDAGHGGFPGYHFVVLLVGCFPTSIFAIRAFFKIKNDNSNEIKPHQKDFILWMKILFWVVLILFTIVKSKIVHYSSMAYFPLTFLAAYVIDNLLENKITFNRSMRFGVMSLGGIFVLALLAAPFVGQNIDFLKPLLAKDPFAAANIEADIYWSGWEVIPGVFLLAILIGFFVMYKNKKWVAFQTLFIGVAIFCMLTLTFFINRIEGISQNAAISFYESKANENALIFTYGYKSYAHLFYAQKRPLQPEFEKKYIETNQINSLARVNDLTVLQDFPTETTIYVVCKIQKSKDLESIEWLEKLESKNGFVFFKRK